MDILFVGSLDVPARVVRRAYRRSSLELPQKAAARMRVAAGKVMLVVGPG